MTEVELPNLTLLNYTLMEQINDRLADEMLAKGYKRYDGSKGYRFANLDTQKFPQPPPGFITGPIASSRGNPLQRQFNVKTIDGWLSMMFKTDREGVAWAVQQAQRVLLECELKDALTQT